MKKKNKKDKQNKIDIGENILLSHIKEVDVNSFKYKLTFKNKVEGDNSAMLQYDAGEIEFRRGLALQPLQITILHEILHAILTQSGFECKKEEELVIILSHGLYSVIRNNNKLLEFIKFNDKK